MYNTEYVYVKKQGICILCESENNDVMRWCRHKGESKSREKKKGRKKRDKTRLSNKNCSLLFDGNVDGGRKRGSQSENIPPYSQFSIIYRVNDDNDDTAREFGNPSTCAPLSLHTMLWIANETIDEERQRLGREERKNDATICNVEYVGVERNIYFTPNKFFPIVFLALSFFFLYLYENSLNVLFGVKILHARQSESTKGKSNDCVERTRVNSVQHWHQQQRYFCYMWRYAVCHMWKSLRMTENSFTASAAVVQFLCFERFREQESRKWNHIINFHYRLQHSKYYRERKPLNLSIKLTHVHSWVEFVVILSPPSRPPSTQHFPPHIFCLFSFSHLFHGSYTSHNSVILHR